MKTIRTKPCVAERLLALREKAGSNAELNARYHTLVIRYQKLILKQYILQRRLSEN